MVTSLSPAKQIVLAEDNSADIMLVRLALQNAGLDCELRVLDDGDKAVAFIEEFDSKPLAGAIDLLLLDMHLPKRNGEEILNRLRSSHRYKNTPVVVMTSSDAPRDHAQAKKLAAMHYFRKPSNLSEYMQLGIIVRGLLSPALISGDLPAGEGEK